ncbi:hypothetical protein K1T71_014172 [Dendrolimus kikuchii]|uniref:Uncharacterized protein n=1 Tax=Dendrolimus kikuchii TaxID=765133 RepID=A0ACC1CFJ0_9NEOP|nr:hypothetical protein K1T71_014172 [Dendrolimus kikuchii]
MAFYNLVYFQCLNRAGLGYAAPLGIKAPLAYDGLGLRGLGYDAPCGLGADIAAASSLNAAWGGSLGVTSSSAIPPTGLNVASDNVYEGNLAVAGNLPFLGTVAMEGTFPSIGAGAVSYGCGDGVVGITAESISPASAISPAAAIAPVAGLASALGLGYGSVGSRGCNAVY